ncbi:MAG TPA: hypothetical protein VN324_06055, partial [Quisquiliibacterium sp.]|nr:hypothetical protein [Quisquiliibacterium sp.]
VNAHYLETGKGPPTGMSPEAAELARIFDALSDDEQKRLRRIIEAAIGPAVSDETVERKMPITRKSARNH